MARPLDRRIIWAVLALLFCLGVWTGLALAVRSWSADLLNTVNQEANRVDRRTQPVEVGGDPDGVFDCEDYALMKRRLLIARGVGQGPRKLSHENPHQQPDGVRRPWQT